jgi:hypothetical protein
MLSRLIGLFLLVLVGGVGCEHTKVSTRPDAGTTPDANAVPGLTVSGTVDEAVQGEGQRAAIIWEVSSGSPDYAYKFGEGTVTQGRFSITLPGDPPLDAINSFGIGVGFVVVLASGVMVPDGKIAADIFEKFVVGISARNSVIWRAKSLALPDPGPPPDWWPLGFPEGFACGVCTPRPDGGSFDGFVPTSCAELGVSVPVTQDVCNWT